MYSTTRQWLTDRRVASRSRCARLPAPSNCRGHRPRRPRSGWSPRRISSRSSTWACYEEARAVLDSVDETHLEAGWQRARFLAFRAALALVGGAKADYVDAIVGEGLAIEGLETPIKFGLERVRAIALLQRGNFHEAERVAIGLTAAAAKTGTRQHAAQALAIAARAGAPDAWLLRWLGALGCSTGGTAARVEHEAYAALVTEPEPIGQLARNALATLRARLVDRTPAVYKKTMLKTLRQVEQRTAALRQTKQEEAQLTIGDEVVRAKEEVGIAGSAPLLMRAVATVARAARSNASLVLTGETGSGKELFARARASPQPARARERSSRSTARRSRSHSSKPSSSATNAARSPARSARVPVSSSKRTAARSSSTRSAR